MGGREWFQTWPHAPAWHAEYQAVTKTSMQCIGPLPSCVKHQGISELRGMRDNCYWQLMGGRARFQTWPHAPCNYAPTAHGWAGWVPNMRWNIALTSWPLPCGLERYRTMCSTTIPAVSASAPDPPNLTQKLLSPWFSLLPRTMGHDNKPPPRCPHL